MTRFDELADAVLDGGAATDDDALDVLRATDDELLDLVAAAGTAAPRALRQHGQGQLPRQPQVRACARRTATTARRRSARSADILKYKWLEHRRGARAGRRRAAGRRHPRLHGLQRPRPDQQRRRAGRRHGRRASSPSTPTSRSAPASACSRTARPSGCARPASTPTTTTSTPPSRTTTRSCRRHTYADRVDTVEKAKTAGLSPCCGLIAGLGETDEQLVEALFALRDARLRLDPGQLPDALRRHAAREHLGPHADAVREHPGDGAVRLPGQGDPDRRRPRDAPAHRCRGWRCTSRTRSSSATTSPPRGRPPRPTSS